MPVVPGAHPGGVGARQGRQVVRVGRLDAAPAAPGRAEVRVLRAPKDEVLGGAGGVQGVLQPGGGGQRRMAGTLRRHPAYHLKAIEMPGQG